MPDDATNADVDYFHDLRTHLEAARPYLVSGEIKACRVLTGEKGSHWFPAGTGAGGACHCGETRWAAPAGGPA